MVCRRACAKLSACSVRQAYEKRVLFELERFKELGFCGNIGSLPNPIWFAERVDRRTHNPLVAGSSPARPTQ